MNPHVLDNRVLFGMATCVYLGYVVGGGSLRPEQVKVEATWSMPVPQTKGIAGYYRKCIPQYSTVALSLTDLTEKTSTD